MLTLIWAAAHLDEMCAAYAKDAVVRVVGRHAAVLGGGQVHAALPPHAAGHAHLLAHHN